MLLLIGAAFCGLSIGGIAPAQERSGQSSVELADSLMGTAPLDDPALVGNAPPPGEPTYSGQTSPGAWLPHSSVEAAPVNVNLELNYPTGVPAPYHYKNPTMIGFTGGGGATYGGNAKPIIMPVARDWTVPPAYSQSWYDKARERRRPAIIRSIGTRINAESGSRAVAGQPKDNMRPAMFREGILTVKSIQPLARISVDVGSGIGDIDARDRRFVIANAWATPNRPAEGDA